MGDKGADDLQDPGVVENMGVDELQDHQVPHLSPTQDENEDVFNTPRQTCAEGEEILDNEDELFKTPSTELPGSDLHGNNILSMAMSSASLSDSYLMNTPQVTYEQSETNLVGEGLKMNTPSLLMTTTI